MKRFAFLTILISLVLFLMVGCDEDKTVNSNLIVGDTSSADFQFVQEKVTQDENTDIGMSLDLTFDLFDQQFGVGAPKLEQSGIMALGQTGDIILIDSATYTFINGWHVFTFEATVIDMFTNDTLDISGIDSIQIQSNGSTLPEPDSTMDDLRIRNYFNWDFRNKSDSGSGTHLIHIAGSTIDSGSVVTINGSANETVYTTVSDTIAECDLDMNNNVNITNVQFVLDGTECPNSGKIMMSSNMDLTCYGQLNSHLDSLTVNGTWTVTAVFNGTQVNVTYTDGTTSWSVIEECGSPVAKFAPKWSLGN
ncbi:MAG: hypothetical protein ACE5D6_03415 [Candidatus Zixiibacteriota bacterium]